jgi:hypothetical protein
VQDQDAREQGCPDGVRKADSAQDVGIYSGKLYYSFLATFFNFAINSLADRLLMEIEENVNGDGEKRRFSQIPFVNRKNMQSQIVICDSRQM